MLSFIILNFNINFNILLDSWKKINPSNNQDNIALGEENSKNTSFNKNIIPEEEIKPTISNFSKLEGNIEENTSTLDSKIEIEIEESKEEEIADVNNLPDYDQKLDLGSFIKPKIDLLIEHDNTGAIKIDENELTKNKNKIEETLLNYKIEIKSIKPINLKSLSAHGLLRMEKIDKLKSELCNIILIALAPIKAPI